MASLGIRANLEIYTSLIDACVQAGGRQWTEVGDLPVQLPARRSSLIRDRVILRLRCAVH